MIFSNPKDLFSELTRIVNSLEENLEEVNIDISTYGIYLSITSDGRDLQDTYPKIQREFVDKFKMHNLRIIVGLYEPSKANGCKDCPHNINNYNNKLLSYIETVKKLGINIRFSEHHHWKYYRVNDFVFTGGMNFGDSGYTDFINTITDKKDANAYKKIFDKLWEKSITIDELKDKMIQTDCKIVIPPTEKQLSFIRSLEKSTGITFDGESKEDASKYIQIALEEKNKKK